MLIFIFLLLLLSVSQQAVNYHKAFTTSGHTDLVTTVSFFNDNLRMVTGSNDYTVKIWDLTNYTLITQLNFSDYIMNVAIHPTDNRIFVLVYDGTIAVHDGTTYLLITSFTYPTTNGNYMVIDPINDKFYVGGYEGAGIAPEIYVYSCTSYALLSQFTTTLPTGD
jgi:WD40 repeat protein